MAYIGLKPKSSQHN